MTIEEIKHYRELTNQGNDTLALRYSMPEEHHATISREISRLQETQAIIEYKLRHFRELAGNPDLADLSCDPPGTGDQRS